MRKVLVIFVVLSMLLGLSACGSEVAYEGLIEQLENGNLEGIKEELCALNPEFAAEQAMQAENAAVLEKYRTVIDALEAGEIVPEQLLELASAEKTSEEIVTSEPEEAQKAEMDMPQQLVLQIVRDFMTEKGTAMVTEFETATASKARELLLTHAMEYRLGNCDGNGSTAHCMLVNLTGDFAVEGGLTDSIQILWDMDIQKRYDSSAMDWTLIEACQGMPTNEEEFNMIAVNSYHSYTAYGAPLLMADSEIREELSAEAIAAVNAALKESVMITE